MESQILKVMGTILELSKQEKNAITSILKTKKLDKMNYVLHEGEICQNIYFIEKGLFRSFSNVDGEDKTSQFFSENTWYTEFQSYLTKKPSMENFQAIEKGELVYFSQNDIEKVYLSFNRIERIGRLFAEQAFITVHNKNRTLTSLSAEDRYIEFISEYPELIKRIPQYYLASFLNIKPESLSRIKKKIISKNN